MRTKVGASGQIKTFGTVVEIIFDNEVTNTAGTVVVAIVFVPKWQTGSVTSGQHHDFFFRTGFGSGGSGGINAEGFQFFFETSIKIAEEFVAFQIGKGFKASIGISIARRHSGAPWTNAKDRVVTCPSMEPGCSTPI